MDGQWHDVFLPWHNFVPVKRAQSDPDGGYKAVWAALHCPAHHLLPEVGHQAHHSSRELLQVQHWIPQRLDPLVSSFLALSSTRCQTHATSENLLPCNKMSDKMLCAITAANIHSADDIQDSLLVAVVCRAGPFELLIDGGIRAFKSVRPQLVHLSSAGYVPDLVAA